MAKRTSGRWRMAQSRYAKVVGASLFALLLVVSSGCGCGDDSFPTPPMTVRCCCNLQWESTIATAAVDVQVALANADPSLNATVTPTFFPTVGAGDFVLVTICVDETHTLGATVDVVFTDNNTAAVLATAILTYGQRCVPTLDLNNPFIFQVMCP